MAKTLMIAAALLTLGASAAFAGDGDVNAPPPPATKTQAIPQSGGQQRLFQASTREHRNVYTLFNGGAFPDGGEG